MYNIREHDGAERDWRLALDIWITPVKSLMKVQEKKFSAKILKEMRELQEESAGIQDRLSRIETTLHSLLGHVKQLIPNGSFDANYVNIDQFITEQIEHSLTEQKSLKSAVPLSPELSENRNWEFFVAKNGGFDEILYMTVQDFLALKDINPVQFVIFLAQKRDKEVDEGFRRLRAEYRKLEGNQLQSHFTKLWEQHHSLLKKKVIRTWKEEIFLEAFNKFINWLQ